jgi:hypothetical protein
MKLQALLWAIGPIGALAIGTPLYLKHQVLVQPTWAETTTVSLADPKALESARAIATAKLRAAAALSKPVDRPSSSGLTPAASPGSSVSSSPVASEGLSINSQELTAIAASEADRLSQQLGIPGVAQSVSAHIADGKLEGGVTVNLSALPPNLLSSQERSALESVLKSIMPELGKQDIYIGLSGQPIVTDGQVEWGPNLRIHIGGIALSVEQVAQKGGINEGDLRHELNRVLAQLKVSSVAIEGDKLRIQGQL